MAKVPEWRWVTVAGFVMVIQTMFDVAQNGPWDAPSFTRGVIGLTGLCCLYIGWFRFTFRQSGIIPSINRWQHQKELEICGFVFTILHSSISINQFL